MNDLNMNVMRMFCRLLLIHRKQTIIIYTVFLVAASLFLFNASWKPENLFTVMVGTSYGYEEIKPWSDGTGMIYLFIPKVHDGQVPTFSLREGENVLLDGKKIVEGMTVPIHQNENTYLLQYTTMFGQRETELTIMNSDFIATMFIDTVSGSMEKIHRKRSNSEGGEYRLYSLDSGQSWSGAVTKLKGRGNGTWSNYDKKPYSLVLERSEDLLGMGSAQKWILLADAGDYSHLRNKLILDFASDFGVAYSPKSEWVDLYLNGEYAGLYLLCEKNEVHEERVDISEQGGFLVSLELESRLRAQNIPYITTGAGQHLRIHYYEGSHTDLQEKWQSIENAILSDTNVDPKTNRHLSDLIDMNSWVKKYLLEEIFGNIDGCCISQYFYSRGVEGNEKVFAGPAWDYDASMGNEVLWQLKSPQRWCADRLTVRNGLHTPWFSALCDQKEFRDEVVKLYQQECIPLLEMSFDSRIDYYADWIESSWKMDQRRWQLNSENIHKEVEQIRNYMKARMVFLYDAWVCETPYVTVIADAGLGTQFAYYSVIPGETVTDLYYFPSTEYEKFCGWYYAGTDILFDSDTRVYKDVSVYAKWDKVSDVKMKTVLKYSTIVIIAVLFIIFIVIDIKQNHESMVPTDNRLICKNNKYE